MKDHVTISIFGTFVAITKCGRYHPHRHVTPASLRRLSVVIHRHRWEGGLFGIGERYYGPVQARARITGTTRWPGEG